MAGVSVGESDENPVNINVTPLVDIIFCLCVFFMISFKFKQLEGKFDSWLPKDKGQATPMNEVMEEIRVAIFWDAANSVAIRQFGKNTIRDDTQLRGLINDAYQDHVKMGKTETPVIIDAAEQVPWKEVVRVVNIAKGVGVDKIEFAAGKDYDAAPVKK